MVDGKILLGLHRTYGKRLEVCETAAYFESIGGIVTVDPTVFEDPIELQELLSTVEIESKQIKGERLDDLTIEEARPLTFNEYIRVIAEAKSAEDERREFYKHLRGNDESTSRGLAYILSDWVEYYTNRKGEVKVNIWQAGAEKYSGMQPVRHSTRIQMISKKHCFRRAQFVEAADDGGVIYQALSADPSTPLKKNGNQFQALTAYADQSGEYVSDIRPLDGNFAFMAVPVVLYHNKNRKDK